MADLPAQRPISDEEREIVQGNNRLFSQAQIYRAVHAGQWEESAALILPTSKNTFFYGSYNFPGQKKTQQQIDSTGALALQQFCAIADAMVTPKNRVWHALESDDYVMKDRKSREYFEAVNKIIFSYRNRADGNFHAQNYSNWQSLGAFGNSIMYIDEIDTRWGYDPGLRYRSIPLGECFFIENHQAVVTTMIRWFRRTAAQAVEAWGEDWLPGSLHTALKENQQSPFNFLHIVKPRDVDDYDPSRLDHKGKPFVSHYQSIEGQCLMAPESGYRKFPYAVSRYDQTPGETYGRGPAQIVLPGLKTLNAQKSTLLKAGHRASDPIYLTADDGLIDFDQTPGSINKGGVNSAGQPMVHTLPVGSVQVNEKMMGIEQNIIEQVFLTPLFKTLMQNPNMTATQVVELMNERGMLVSPVLGRQQTEYVASGLVPREIDILSRMRGRDGKPVFPPMPPRVRESRGHYEVVDTSPLAMAARANEAAGFMRWVEFLRQVSLDTQDPSVMDRVDFDTASPKVAEINGVPLWGVADDSKVAAKRKNRAQAQQRTEQIQALPAQAAMLKAQSVVRKNELGSGPVQNTQPQQQQAI